MRCKLICLASIFLLLLMPIVSAVPGIPNLFSGNVYIAEEPASEGITVTAEIDGEVKATDTVNADGEYTLAVSGEDSDLILFYIEDQKADEEATYDLSGSGVYELDLNVDLFCGDKVCNTNETYSNCPDDCEAPYTPPQQQTPQQNPQGPGGGPGGCTQDWNCGEWSECGADGIQTRTCNVVKTCGKPGPELTKECTPPITTFGETEEGTEEETEVETTSTVGEEPTTGALGVGLATGLFNGIKENKLIASAAIVTLAIIIILFGIRGFFKVKKRKK